MHALEGFVDAGSAVRLAVESILATREHFTLATFDADLLIDYRARRPVLTFEQDRFTAVDPPEIKLFQVIDADGTPFLLLRRPGARRALGAVHRGRRADRRPVRGPADRRAERHPARVSRTPGRPG